MRFDRNRRHILTGMAGLMLASPALATRLLQTTPQQAAGPFYPLELPLDDDNDLTQIQGREGVAQGQITDLSGRILDINGRILRNLRIEIWQCDINGRYRHPGDRSDRAIDENFQGHGHTLTDNNGRYRFRTIRPMPYSGRTPHIHIAVFPEGASPFVTQLYVKGEPRNAQDYLFNLIPAERRELVVAEFAPNNKDAAQLSANFDIIMHTTQGTPKA